MRRITRRGFAAAALGAASSVLAAGTAATAGGPAGAPAGDRKDGTGRSRPEMRGMWLATIGNRDWPSTPGQSAARQQQELLAHLDAAVESRLNTVIFQVRPSADALWPSPHEPWAECLTGVQGRDPGWDPLGFAVREAHRRGLELHAWFNPYRVANHADPGRLAPAHPARRHPDWVVPYGGKLYYNPGLPEVRRFVQEAMLDAVRRYPVDGVHFDDYFYPYPAKGEPFRDDAAYAAHGKGFANRADWRRDNINRLVRETAQQLEGVERGGRGGRCGSASARSRSGAMRRPTLRAQPPGPGWRRTTICTPTPAAGCGRAGSTTSFRRSTGTSERRAPTTRSWWTGGRGPSRAPAWTSTSARRSTRRATRRSRPPGGTRPNSPATSPLPGNYPQVGGHVFFSAKEVSADRVGALARVVRDHYGSARDRSGGPVA